MTASVSSACTVSFCVVRSWNRRRTHSCRSGPRHDLIAAGDFDELQAAGPLVVLLQLGERRLHVFLRLGVEQLEDRLRRQRLGRREDQRLENRLQLGARAPGQRAGLARPSSPRSSPPASAVLVVHDHPALARPDRSSSATMCPPDRRSGAARRPAARACRRGSGRTQPDWNTRTSFSRIISSSARNVTIRPPRVVDVGEQILEPARLGLRQPRQQLLDAQPRPESARAAAAPSAAASRAASTAWNAPSRLKRSTSSSGSYSSPAISATRSSGRCHCAARSCLALVQQLGGGLELLVLEQPAHQRVARILFLALDAGGRLGPRQQHLRLDVDQRRRHHEELARDVEVQLLHAARSRRGTAA